MLDATPVKENMPISYYDAKRMVSKLGLELKKIDYYIGGCMLFYDNELGTNDEGLEEWVRMEKWDVHIAWDTQKRLLWKWMGNFCGLTVTVDDDISPVNGIIKIKETTSLGDTVVVGQQVDATILLSTNHVEKEQEESGDSEDNNIGFDEGSEYYDDE
ncbi:hypothetical protein KIW84_021865 [Lathyrus oleraceus]|uniref:Uncharacterized protein n=1 Tax=Pisum sativum TaxID=3888 RepID=A0A9D4YER9_PEA|nr:hypothetical protein KIW84_021865 [Pisum sativum]